VLVADAQDWMTPTTTIISVMNPIEVDNTRPAIKDHQQVNAFISS
jgi:hypothetical protein